MPDPLGSARESNARSLGRIEATLDSLIAGQHETRENIANGQNGIRELIQQSEARIMAQVDPLKLDAAEFRRIKAMGMTLSAVASVIFTVVGGFVATHWKQIMVMFR